MNWYIKYSMNFDTYGYWLDKSGKLIPTNSHTTTAIEILNKNNMEKFVDVYELMDVDVYELMDELGYVRIVTRSDSLFVDRENHPLNISQAKAVKLLSEQINKPVTMPHMGTIYGKPIENEDIIIRLTR